MYAVPPRRLSLSLITLLAAGCLARSPFPSEAAHRPLRAEAFWSGLGAASVRAPGSGVKLLHTPVSPRVTFVGGAFQMGSTALDIKRAEVSCQNEPLGARCEEGKAIFVAEAPAHEVTLSPYAIDRTEVTVEAYERCESAGACPPRLHGDRDARFDRPDLPVTYVDWDAATTFCGWAGGRLPSEAEWEFAARGPQGRQYPWGQVYNGFLCNHGTYAPDDTDATDGFAGLAPVGSFPDGATPSGVLDLSGNAAEWVSDLYASPDENGFGYPKDPQVNPRGPKFGAFHVVRGGSFQDGAAWLRGASRSAQLGASPAVGFRCAADVR